MSVLQQALTKLDASVRKLEGTIEYFEELKATEAGQPDMFAATTATPPAASNTNSAELAQRLDSAIGKVEKILADGTQG